MHTIEPARLKPGVTEIATRDGNAVRGSGTAVRGKALIFWDLATGKERLTLSDQVGWVKSLRFSPDGTWLAYSGNDATVRLRDLAHDRSRRLGPLSSQPRPGKARS